MSTVKNLSALIVAAALAFVLAATGTFHASAQGQSGTTLSATVDITGYWTITYPWTIDKSVTPETWHLFKGDSGTSEYTITVTKGDGVEEAWVAGEICVTNGGEDATENLTIVAELKDGYAPPNDFLASEPVDVSGNPVLDPGEEGCYSYTVSIPITGGAFPQPHAGGTYKVTAHVTITNHSGDLGNPSGPSPSATTVFPASATLIDNTIHVDDTNGGSWEFSSSGSESYEMTFTCDADEGKHDNTATIRDSDQSDDASVTVNCYALQVRKNALTSFTRTYDWMIDKSADRSALTLSVGQQFLVNYTIVVDATYADSDWAVNGVIGIRNPAPIAATINSVSDVVSPDITATVDCGVTFPYTLAAHSALTCTYSADLPDASARTNTAAATLQNYDYDSELVGTPAGTTDFTGTAPVDFSDPEITHIDECIDVSDTYAGFLGTVCFGVDTLPKTFNYSRWIGPYETCGSYTVANTASYVTNDTAAPDNDSWTVNVSVPCIGCTLTQGYWKTHSSYGPAPYDDTWALLSGGADTPFFSSLLSWFQAFWTPPTSGNAYFILAHQYMAARLNILNGAGTTPAVDVALTWAGTFFANNTPSSKLTKSVRATTISYAYLLGQYNQGAIGPGHCSE